MDYEIIIEILKIWWLTQLLLLQICELSNYFLQIWKQFHTNDIKIYINSILIKNCCSLFHRTLQRERDYRMFYILLLAGICYLWIWGGFWFILYNLPDSIWKQPCKRQWNAVFWIPKKIKLKLNWIESPGNVFQFQHNINKNWE